MRGEFPAVHVPDTKGLIMIQSASDIQKRSDEKRGIKPKTYKLPLATIARIELLASQGGVSQGAIITAAIDIYERSLNQ